MKKKSFPSAILTISVIINTSIFFFISLLHFYWAFGGKIWLDDVLPTSTNGFNKLNPGTIACLIVAFGLLFMALITAGNQDFFDRYIKRKYFNYGALIISMVFLLRAIGDFKFIGFFKTVKLTRFGINDTEFFSPLCLVISLLSLLIFILNRNKASKV